MSRVLYTFGRNRLALLALFGLIVIVAATVMAHALTPYDPIGRDAESRLLPPSLLHPMGTDSLGRDVLARVLYGGRVSLQVGLISIILAIAFFGAPLIPTQRGGAVEARAIRWAGRRVAASWPAKSASSPSSPP